MTRDRSFVIDLRSLTRSFVGADNQKAGGPDLVLDDVAKAEPEAVAKVVHPFLVKQDLQLQKALAQKGAGPTTSIKGPA